MRSDKVDKAYEYFSNGYNCAQSVVNSFAEDLGFDEHLGNSFAAGFGGGMGKMGKTCGAVTGAFMVIGVFNQTMYTDVAGLKANSNRLIKRFTEKFIIHHGHLDCFHLINTDMNTQQGKDYYDENNLKEKVCKKCIANAIQITENLILEEKK